MSGKLYLRLALQGIGKNKKIYFPYLLAASGCVGITYILFFLSSDLDVANLNGSAQIALSLGCWVIVLFSAIFLLYTSRFVSKQRRREFGLLNVLGLGKRHIARVIAWESVLSFGISMVLGLAFGILFSKLGVLLLMKMLGQSPSLTFSVSIDALSMTALFFAAIFALLFLLNLIQVGKSSAIALLRSASTGEKPPKANYVTALLGLLALGGGYYLSVSAKNPFTAISVFFIAVILVIIGTYLCFISASVAFLKLLQKNKRYYYKSNHFISVSTMLYRMRRNGAGLASICIILTMILVMLSSTVCLNTGIEDSLQARYPWDIQLTHCEDNRSDIPEAAAREVLQEEGVTAQRIDDLYTATFYAHLQDNVLEPSAQSDPIGQNFDLSLMSLADYNRLTGENVSLATDEVLWCSSDFPWKSDTLTLCGTIYRVKETITRSGFTGEDMASILLHGYIIFPTEEEINAVVDHVQAGENPPSVWCHTILGINVDMTEEDQIDLAWKIENRYCEKIDAIENNESYYRKEVLAINRADFAGMYTGLLFLGIILGIAFLLAAVLIIYNKQISEGYEDAGRYQILRDVGMTDTEIRKSINSQVMTVFFAPLLVAGIHILFAMPLIFLLMAAMGFVNRTLFIIMTLITFLLVGLVYAGIYLATSRVYYRIVNPAKAA